MRFIEVRTFLRIRSDSLFLSLDLALFFFHSALADSLTLSHWPDIWGASVCSHTPIHTLVFFLSFANQIRKAADTENTP